MRIGAGELDRRITIMRAETVDDGTATVLGEPIAIGSRRAKKTDVSDGERVRAAEQSQQITSRFLVRADPLTRTIDGKDTLIYHGKHGEAAYQVTGTKDSSEREDGIEISAVARPDAVAA